MASSVLLGKHLRRQIRAKVWPMLEQEGFVEFGPLRAYRLGDRTIETVEFVTFKPEWREPRWLGGDAYANGGTFSLHVGTFFLENGQKDHRPKAHECHCGTRLAHESMDSAADGRTFWPGPTGERLDEIVEEAVRVLRARGLDHLRHYSSGNRHAPIQPEEVGLSTAEAAEMMRICREGRAARANALDDLHRRLHLSDEHYISA